MATLIKILVDNVSIDIVQETLSIKMENDALITDFKVSYTSYPFLVVENARTLSAMGPRNLASLRKKKRIPCTVVFGLQRFYGEIVINEYLPNHRKCDLRFGSALVPLMSENIGTFMPTFSITGETEFEPYAETSETVPAGRTQWPDYVGNFVGKVYPDVFFTFPEMVFATKYWETKPTDKADDWYNWQGIINLAENVPGVGFRYKRNIFLVDGDATTVTNVNNVAPQLFLLGILHYIFVQNGWKINGSFVSDAFIRRLLLHSDATNMTKCVVGPEITSYNWDDMVYRFGDNFGQYWFRNPFSIISPGEYVFTYSVTEPLRDDGNIKPYSVSELRFSFIDDPAEGVINTWDGDAYLAYKNYNDANALVFEGEVTVTVPEDMALPATLYVWYSKDMTMGPQTQVPTAFNVVKKVNQKNFYAEHPTVQLSRYVPEWTVSTFISELKKMFCLDVSIDEISRTVSFDFSAQSMQQGKEILSIAPYSEKYESPEFIGYVLKMANSTDSYLYIDAEGTTEGKNPDDDYTKLIESKFKNVPNNGTTAVLDKLSDKDGTGIMIFEPGSDIPRAKMRILETYNEKTLNITGAGGIYETYWKKILRVLINGPKITVTLTMTETELRHVNNFKAVHFANQNYYLLNSEAKPTRQDNFTVTLELIAVLL